MIKDSGERRTFSTGAEMKKEVWRDVVGYEGLYQVSSMGQRCCQLRKKRQSTKAKTR